MAIATRFPDIKITVLDFACGGAKIVKGLLYGWTGPEPPLIGPDLPSQLEALEEYTVRTSRKIDAIVMNIGGNDARFADIVGACVFWPFDCSDDSLLKEVGEID